MDARIVVIDNDESMRELFTLCLKKEGGQVLSYRYDQIDRAALEQQPPDLIILDFNVRDEGVGWSMLQLLKMDETTARIPILLTTTTFLLSAEVQSYLLTRFIRVVHKPFAVEAFLTLVQNTLTLAGRAGTLFSSAHPLPILVVDDSEDLRDDLIFVLGLEGYLVATASNGQEALEAVSRTNHSLIVLDLAMPIMNGFEFLSAYDRQLRPHTPVMIVSGETDIQTHTLPSFVVEVLTKPVDLNHLLGLIGKYALPI